MKEIIKRNAPFFLLTCLFSVVSAGILAFFAIKLGELIDLITKPNSSLQMRVLECAVIITIWFGVAIAYNVLRSQYAFRVIKDTKAELYSGINRMTMSGYESKTNEHYLNIFTKNFDILHENYLIPKCDIIANAASAIVSIAVIFWIDWKLALSFVAVTLVTIVLSQLPGVIMAKKTQEFSDSSAKYLKIINNHLQAFEQIKLLRLFPYMQKLYLKSDKKFEESRRGFYTTTWTADSLGIFFSFLAQLGCFSIGVFFVLRGDLTIGLLIAAINLINSVFNPVQELVQAKNLMGTVKEIFTELDSMMNVPVPTGKLLPAPISQIDYQDVTVQLPNNRTLLTNFNYSFEKGKRYAIVGQSGSGKSTLMKLLMGYYPADYFSGQILIDGCPVEQILPDEVYKRIAYIQRNEFFVPGTVEDNILLQREAADPSTIYSCLRLSPELLAQTVEAGARHQVSQGEKQRIDMARFLISDYDLLIFDEPSTNLDPATSELIFNYIMNITDKIVIVITHEASKDLLNRFDQVLDLASYSAS